MYRAAVLLAALLLVVAVGPWSLPVLAAPLLLPRVRERARDRLRPERPWRALGLAVASVGVVAGVVVVVPDGWLPVPQGPGRLVTPAYVGRPAIVRPLTAPEMPPHPQLAPVEPWSGPVGDQPGVDSAWYGTEGCPVLALDAPDRLVALCGDAAEPVLRVVDGDSMRTLASRELAGRAAPDGMPCGAGYLGTGSRAVVATGDELLVVATRDGEDEPDLTVEASHDLADVLAEDDCVVAVHPDWGGRIWFATHRGVVGAVDEESGAVRTTDLGEEVTNGLAADEQGGVYVVSTGAVYRMLADDAGRPRTLWRSQYDAGSEVKPGQLSRGSGTPATLLPNGTLAVADNAEPRMQVVFLEQRTGERVCEAAVFEDDASATEAALLPVGASGVVVENNHGADGGPGDLLGFTSSPGLARVDVVEGECRVRWTTDAVTAPGAVPALAPATGLLYTWTKRPSLWGVPAWYLTALDAHTGRHVFSVRGGTGPLMADVAGPVTLAPDGSAYVATRAGLVRVRDKVRG